MGWGQAELTLDRTLRVCQLWVRLRLNGNHAHAGHLLHDVGGRVRPEECFWRQKFPQAEQRTEAHEHEGHALISNPPADFHVVVLFAVEEVHLAEAAGVSFDECAKFIGFRVGDGAHREEYEIRSMSGGLMLLRVGRGVSAFAALAGATFAVSEDVFV